MPEPAGTGLSRRKFLSRSAGLALAVYGATKIPLSAFEDRDRPGRAPATRSSSRSSSTAASTRSACWRRSATPATRSCGRTSPCRRRRDRPSPRTRSLQLAPVGGGARDPARRGQGQRLPGDRLRPPRPVPLHLAPLLRDRRAAGRLPAPAGSGRYIDAVGDDDNPLQGLSLDGALSPMLATAEKPVAAIDSVDGYDLWSPGQRPDRSGDVPQLRPLRLAALRLARPGPGAPRHLADRQAAPGPGRRRRLQQPGRLPRQLVRPQARRPRRLHRRRPADAGGDDPRPRRLRHPRRPGERPRQTTCSGPARRCSPSSATSRRAASPTGC